VLPRPRFTVSFFFERQGFRGRLSPFFCFLVRVPCTRPSQQPASLAILRCTPNFCRTVCPLPVFGVPAVDPWELLLFARPLVSFSLFLQSRPLSFPFSLPLFPPIRCGRHVGVAHPFPLASLRSPFFWSRGFCFVFPIFPNTSVSARQRSGPTQSFFFFFSIPRDKSDTFPPSFLSRASLFFCSFSPFAYSVVLVFYGVRGHWEGLLGLFASAFGSSGALPAVPVCVYCDEPLNLFSATQPIWGQLEFMSQGAIFFFFSPPPTRAFLPCPVQSTPHFNGPSSFCLAVLRVFTLPPVPGRNLFTHGFYSF